MFAQMQSPDFITIVSGLPRSGTSLMMQMLTAGGLPAMTDALRPADQSNPRGYLEFEPVKRLRADRSWLPDARGRVVKIIHLLLRELPTDGSLSYRVVFMKRPIDEVIASQRSMLQRDGKLSVDAAMLKKIYQGQLAQIEQWLSEQAAFKFLPVNYHDVLREPARTAETLSAFLELPLDQKAMPRAVDPALYRERSSETKII